MRYHRTHLQTYPPAYPPAYLPARIPVAQRFPHRRTPAGSGRPSFKSQFVSWRSVSPPKTKFLPSHNEISVPPKRNFGHPKTKFLKGKSTLIGAQKPSQSPGIDHFWGPRMEFRFRQVGIWLGLCRRPPPAALQASQPFSSQLSRQPNSPLLRLFPGQPSPALSSSAPQLSRSSDLQLCSFCLSSLQEPTPSARVF